MAMNDNQPLAGCRVLVIEDEYFIADDLEHALRASGAEIVGPFGTVGSAMQEVTRGAFEVVVLDINLHDEMAYSVADELRRQNMPFLFATGYDASAIPSRFAGVRRWQKPYHLPGLISDIGDLCAAREPSAPMPGDSGCRGGGVIRVERH
jgi:DNA-binding response OmpR family regulator